MNWRSPYITAARPAAGPPSSTTEERPPWGPVPRLPLTPAPRQPWNPVFVAWMGIAFSPVWAGVMAALNARRLQLGLPWWRPIAIGVGTLVLDILVSMFFEAYLVDLLLYGGALALIWFIDLVRCDFFRSHAANTGQPGGGWVWPSLIGAPIALLVFFTFVVSPFIPLEPREVEKLVAATKESEMKKYTTANLWPALTALTRMAQQTDTETTLNSLMSVLHRKAWRVTWSAAGVSGWKKASECRWMVFSIWFIEKANGKSGRRYWHARQSTGNPSTRTLTFPPTTHNYSHSRQQSLNRRRSPHQEQPGRRREYECHTCPQVCLKAVRGTWHVFFRYEIFGACGQGASGLFGGRGGRPLCTAERTEETGKYKVVQGALAQARSIACEQRTGATPATNNSNQWSSSSVHPFALRTLAMTIAIHCPCGERFLVPEETAGAICPACGAGVEASAALTALARLVLLCQKRTELRSVQAGSASQAAGSGQLSPCDHIRREGSPTRVAGRLPDLRYCQMSAGYPPLSLSNPPPREHWDDLKPYRLAHGCVSGLGSRGLLGDCLFDVCHQG